MKMPRFLYVVVDKRTGDIYSSRNRSNGYYESLNSIKIVMKYLAAHHNIDHYKVVKYSLNYEEDLTE